MKAFRWASIAVLIAGLITGGAQLAHSYYSQKGEAYFNQDDFSSAKNAFLKASYFWPWDPETYYWLGRIALGPLTPDSYHPNENEAITYYKKADALGLGTTNPYRHALSLNNIGHAYWRLENFKEADTWFLKNIAEHPDYASRSRYTLAYDYFTKFNRPQEALEVLSFNPEASAVKPIHNMYALLARLYFFSSNYPKAKEFAEKAITDATPGGIGYAFSVGTARGVLANIYGIEKDFAQAEEEIRKINELAPNPANNCPLAQAYFFGGDYKKAIAIAKPVPESVTYLSSICTYTLGKSYQALGNQEEASKYFQKYLEQTDKLPEKIIFVNRNRDEIMRMK